MAHPLIDMTGQRFGRLTVVKISDKKQGTHRYWECKCDCGNTTYVMRMRLIDGSTKSCGCYRVDKGKLRQTHGERKTRLYRIWTGIKDRTLNHNSKYWSRYGERGISIYPQWANSFETFRDWALSNGYSDNLTLDRIDNDKGYEPNNCRWADWLIQQNNKRNTIYCEYEGEIIPLSILSRQLGISNYLCRKRYQIHG